MEKMSVSWTVYQSMYPVFEEVVTQTSFKICQNIYRNVQITTKDEKLNYGAFKKCKQWNGDKNNNNN